MQTMRALLLILLATAQVPCPVLALGPTPSGFAWLENQTRCVVWALESVASGPFEGQQGRWWNASFLQTHQFNIFLLRDAPQGTYSGLPN